MATNENNIFLSVYGSCIRKEAVSDGVIYPGMLVDRAGAKVKASAKAEDALKQILVADLDTVNAGAISSKYDDGAVVNFKAPLRGELVRLYVGASTTLAVGDEVASKGNGAVGAPASAGVGVIGIAMTAVTTSGGETGFVTVEII